MNGLGGRFSNRQPPSGRSAADRQPIETQSGLADADRHGLAVLAASADASIEFQVITNH